ncbi:hypothetical protein M758_UG090700, partial [Ceratodon purpureus]
MIVNFSCTALVMAALELVVRSKPPAGSAHSPLRFLHCAATVLSDYSSGFVVCCYCISITCWCRHSLMDSVLQMCLFECLGP